MHHATVLPHPLGWAVVDLGLGNGFCMDAHTSVACSMNACQPYAASGIFEPGLFKIQKYAAALLSAALQEQLI